MSTEIAHEERAHAKRSPSSSKRWMSCPGSIRLEENIPDSTSAFAAEGVAAHELAEICLRNNQDAVEYIDRTVNGFVVDGPMAEGAQVYVDWFREQIWDSGQPNVANEHLIEEKVHITCIEDTGTADGIIYREHDYTLVVGDLKFGRGVPVEVEDNTQGLLYALGAIKRFHNRRIDRVEIVIIQPRCPHPDGPIRTWVVEYDVLIDWALELQAAVDATKQPDAPLIAGTHCKFCKAAPVCPALRDKSLEVAMADFGPAEEVIVSDPATLSPETLAKTLREVEVLKLWCKRIEDYAYAEAAAGRMPPGYKLVATRATRKWKDEAKARQFLELYGLDDKDMLTNPELKSVAQLEKAIGKKNTADIAHLVEKVSSGTTLAKVEDPRPPVTPDAMSDFGASNQGESDE